MTDLEAEERRYLESARRVLSPSAADAERVLAAVSRAIALPGTEAFDTKIPESDPSKLLGAGSRLSLPRWLLAAVLAGGFGGLGYGAGFRAGERSLLPSPAAPSESALPHRNSEGERSAGERVMPSAAPALVDTRSKPARTSSARAETSAPIHSAAPPEKPEKPESDSLSEEVRTLRRVERALREQNPRLALALLGDLDRAVPSGQFGEERLAASIQARCLLGYGSPWALREEFVHSHGLYVERRSRVQPRRRAPERR